MVVTHLFFSSTVGPVEYRYLSNFTRVEITYKGRTFPSVEHAFQGSKAEFTSRGVDVKRLTSFTSTGQYAALPGAKIKSLGGKGAWKKAGVELDRAAWAVRRAGWSRAHRGSLGLSGSPRCCVRCCVRSPVTPS